MRNLTIWIEKWISIITSVSTFPCFQIKLVSNY